MLQGSLLGISSLFGQVPDRMKGLKREVELGFRVVERNVDRQRGERLNGLRV